MVNRSKASANKHASMLQTDSLDNPGEASTESASACRSVPSRLRVGFLAFLSLATAVLTAPLQVAATQPAPAGAIERTALAEHPVPSGIRANNPVAVPGRPTNVRATESGHNTINLAWRAPTDDGGAPITGYRIEWSASGNSPWQTVGLSSPVRVWAHRGLDPGTTRYYRVRAVNSAGTGSASDVDSATTEPLPVVTISAVRRFRTEGAPAVFELARDGNLTRSLSVDVAVAETGDMISGSAPVTVSFAADRSTVRLRVATDDDDADEPDSDITAAVQSGSTYTVGSNAIATVTVADNDDPAVAPGMPTNLRATQGGHNTINLAWRAPTDDGGAPVSGYRIEWSRSGNGQWRAIILTAPVQVWAHDGLDPGTTRYYRVSAINSAGTGAASDIDSAKTKALPVVTISAVPSSPTEGVSAVFELTREGNLPSSLSVDVAVTETGDMISGAAPSTVRFSAGQGTVKLQVPTDNDDADEPDSEITATVQSGSAYTVGSNATATVTVADNDDPVEVPGVPTNLSATQGGHNTINLAWRAPTDDGGAPVSGYRVEWSPSGQWEAREAVVLTSPVTVWAHGGLDPGTTRYYRVSAINSAGTGAASDVDSATTEALPVVTISAVSRSLTEGDSALFQLTRDGDLTSALSVDVAVTETGDMISGSAPSTVSFSADQGTVTLTVATDDDDADESDSDITATVQSGSVYTVGSNAAATVTIADDDDPVTVPGAPTNLSATADGQAAINLAWEAPLDTGNAPITSYRIEVSSDRSSWEDLLANSGSLATTYAHGGLDPGTTRYYRVSAINSAGTGAASDVDSATTEALPVVTISAVSRSLTEGDSALFQLTRDGNLTSPLSVDVAVTETGDMISGSAPSSVSFSADQGTFTLSVATDDDDADEPDSDITAAVQSGSVYTAGSNAAATVTVTDDDDPVDVPGVPTNLRATADGQAAINLAWEAPLDTGNAPITGYRIEVSSDHSSWEDLLANTGSAATTYAHGGLPPGATRYYRVSAINSAGTGATSDVDSATTEALPVVTISAVSNSPTEGAPAVFELTRDGNLTSALSVDVAVTETGDMISGSAPSTVSFSADQSTATLTVATDNDDADEPDSDIRAAVQSGSAYTVGSNAAATVTVADDDDPVDVPGVPTNLNATADGQAAIDLAWEAPLDTGNAPITGYRIEVSSDGSGWEDLLANTGSAATTYAHGGLDPGTTRYYRVSAINSAGTGAASNAASASTEEAPLPVVTISAVSNSPTEGAPAVFELTRDGDLNSSLSVDVAVTETGDMISGSAPSTVSFSADQGTFTLSVATDDDDADEPDSDITAAVQSGSVYTVGSNAAATVTVDDDDDPVDVPGVPTNLKATADGQAAINLAWEAPLDTGNAPITGYRIEVSSDRSSWEDLLANSGSAATTYAHGGLPPGTTRHYRVSAINSAGTGAASNVASASTEEAPLPVVTISTVSRSPTEGDVALFQLTRNGDLTSSLSVDVAVTETGDMISGSAPSTVSFSADQGTFTLTVATDNDDADEPDSDIRATVQSGSAYTVGSRSTATVTIADDDDPVDVPGVPTNLRATADGQAAINLAWVAPRKTGNAPITGYRIEVSSDGVSWGHLLANTGSAAKTYAHGGLPPGTTRHYRVSAINSAGIGAASNVASASTEEAPLPVVRISAVSRSLTEGDAAVFELTRNGNLGNTLLAYVDITETGDMISGRMPSSVRFPARRNTVTLIVATDDDDTDESSSVITAIVRSGSTYTVGSNAAATVTVADNDDPVDVPGVPTNLSATADGQMAINLAWVAPRNTGNAPTTGYRIEVSSDGSSWEHLLANTGSTATTYAHRGLDPGTTRYYRVSAINSAGIGAASNVASAATEQAPLPIVTISAVSRSLTEGDAAVFQLTRDGDLGNPLFADVDITETGDMISGNTPSSVGFPAHQNTVTLIVATDDDDTDEPDSDITATVQSGSAYTVGSRSAATVTIADDDEPVDVPGVPTNLSATAHGRTAINLAWVAPRNTGNAPITGYRIEVSSDGSSWEHLLANTGSTATTYAHRGLPPGTTRHYRVYAINSAGTGAASNVASAATEQAPLPVVGISAVSPSLTEGAPAIFQLTRDGDLGNPLFADVDITETGDMISGRTPSSVRFPARQNTVTLIVATDNDDADESSSVITAIVRSGSTYTVGSSAAATVTVADDDEPVDIPGVPTNLSATANGQATINLAWVAPRNTGNAPITGYRIEVSSDGGSWGHLLANTGSTATTCRVRRGGGCPRQVQCGRPHRSRASVMGRFPSSSIFNRLLSRQSVVFLAWCRGSFGLAVRRRVRRGGGCPRQVQCGRPHRSRACSTSRALRRVLASVRGQRIGCQRHAQSKSVPECLSPQRARTRHVGSANEWAHVHHRGPRPGEGTLVGLHQHGLEAGVGHPLVQPVGQGTGFEPDRRNPVRQLAQELNQRFRFAGDLRLRHDLALLVENANRRACQRYIQPDIDVHVVALSCRGIGARLAARPREHAMRARATTAHLSTSEQAETSPVSAKPHYGISNRSSIFKVN